MQESYIVLNNASRFSVDIRYFFYTKTSISCPTIDNIVFFGAAAACMCIHGWLMDNITLNIFYFDSYLLTLMKLSNISALMSLSTLSVLFISNDFHVQSNH